MLSPSSTGRKNSASTRLSIPDFFPLAVSEIVRHSALDVRPLLGEIALGFQNGPADQSVESAAHLGDPALEIEGRQISAKFLDQQLPEIGLDLVMAGFSRKMAQKIYRGRSDHLSKIAAASERDNPGGRPIRSFLHNFRHLPGQGCGPGPSSSKPRNEPYTGP
jgi:hypothetical protein